ncbi:cell envelope integrity protein TolA [Methylohalobius crimeensis]|uniref:cell envelope integrity protein TolA n=1 Tax=Methylohalobius crimeensis TaxID=244365 RepID=UPI0003B493A8|nr:cell envelope integrity protein TolA [Methylohalobius crimeensis]
MTDRISAPNRPSLWGVPFFASLAMHLVLLGLLLFRWDASSTPSPTPPQPREIIHATAVDQAQVEAEMQRLEAREAAERRAAQAAREKLERQRRAEERRLAALKRQQQEEKKRLQTLAEARRQKAEEEARRQAERKKREQAEKARLAKLERERQEAERKRLEEEKKRREAERKRKAEEAARRKAEEAARRKAEAARKKAEAARKQQEIQAAVNEASYRIQQRVESYWLRPASYHTGLSCTIHVRLIPGGEVVEARVVRSSGNAAFDRSAEVAVRKASPLPVSDDPAVFETFREFNFKFDPEG